MKYYVVHNGEIIFKGTEEECAEIIMNDTSGELEIYPEKGRV